MTNYFTRNGAVLEFRGQKKSIFSDSNFWKTSRGRSSKKSAQGNYGRESRPSRSNYLFPGHVDPEPDSSSRCFVTTPENEEGPVSNLVPHPCPRPPGSPAGTGRILTVWVQRWAPRRPAASCKRPNACRSCCGWRGSGQTAQGCRGGGRRTN